MYRDELINTNAEKILDKSAKWTYSLRGAIEKGINDPSFRSTQLALGIPEGKMIDEKLYIKTRSIHLDDMMRKIERVFVVLTEQGKFYPLYKNQLCPLPDNGYILCIKSLAPFVHTTTELEYICNLSRLQADYNEGVEKDEAGRSHLIKSDVFIKGEENYSFLTTKVKEAISERDTQIKGQSNLYTLFTTVDPYPGM